MHCSHKNYMRFSVIPVILQKKEFMEIAQFSNLNEEEKELMIHVPALVTILLAGIDNEIDMTEEEQANRLVHIRATTGDPILFDFFKKIEKDFNEQLALMNTKFMNLEKEVRFQKITDELTKLNDILPKLDPLFARAFLKSMRTFAGSVAESSGGIFGFLSVSFDEKQLIGLEMITYEP